MNTFQSNRRHNASGHRKERNKGRELHDENLLGLMRLTWLRVRRLLLCLWSFVGSINECDQYKRMWPVWTNVRLEVPVYREKWKMKLDLLLYLYYFSVINASEIWTSPITYYLEGMYLGRQLEIFPNRWMKLLKFHSGWYSNLKLYIVNFESSCNLRKLGQDVYWTPWTVDTSSANAWMFGLMCWLGVCSQS